MPRFLPRPQTAAARVRSARMVRRPRIASW